MDYHFQNTPDKTYFFQMLLNPAMLSAASKNTGTDYYYLTYGRSKWDFTYVRNTLNIQDDTSDSYTTIDVKGTDENGYTLLITNVDKKNAKKIVITYKSTYTKYSGFYTGSKTQRIPTTQIVYFKHTQTTTNSAEQSSDDTEYSDLQIHRYIITTDWQFTASDGSSTDSYSVIAVTVDNEQITQQDPIYRYYDATIQTAMTADPSKAPGSIAYKLVKNAWAPGLGDYHIDMMNGNNVALYQVVPNNKEVCPNKISFTIDSSTGSEPIIISAQRKGDRRRLLKDGIAYYFVDPENGVDYGIYDDYFSMDWSTIENKFISLATASESLGRKLHRVSTASVGIPDSDITQGTPLTQNELEDQLQYCTSITPRQIRYCNGTDGVPQHHPDLSAIVPVGDSSGKTGWQNIYSVFLREAGTGNELSLIWKQPKSDSVVVFESEYPGQYEFEVKQPGYYRITMAGGGGGSYNVEKNPESDHLFGVRTKKKSNGRKTYTGGSAAGVFGIMYIDDVGTLNIQVGRGGSSFYNKSKTEVEPTDDSESMSYIQGILSCEGGTSGQKGQAGLGGRVIWEGFTGSLDRNGISISEQPFTQGSIPLLYDTYIWPTVVIASGETGSYSKQSGTTGEKITDENLYKYQGGTGPFDGVSIPPKSNGTSVSNGAGSGLNVEVGKRVKFSTKASSFGSNGYVRLEYIYDENMIR